MRPCSPHPSVVLPRVQLRHYDRRAAASTGRGDRVLATILIHGPTDEYSSQDNPPLDAQTIFKRGLFAQIRVLSNAGACVLARREAAVENERGASGEGGLVGGQVECGMGHLLGPA